MKQYAFRDAEFMSAREKALVLKAWVRFLKNGLRWEDFSDRLYKHLSLHCSFIAHYNRAGFYATYFENGEDTTRFLSQFDKRGECRSVEYGGSWFDGEYEDLRIAMVEEASEYIPTLIDQASGKAKAADLAEVRRLASKHGFKIQQG
jgi:indole-3-glycerol phosphate synthase